MCKVSSACGDYVRFQLPKSSVTTNYQFYLGNAKGFDLPNDDKYTAADHGMFTFTVRMFRLWRRGMISKKKQSPPAAR